MERLGDGAAVKCVATEQRWRSEAKRRQRKRSDLLRQATEKQSPATEKPG